ncbi:putative competence/damage-inducible protein CinA [Nemania sp. FL0031]|nr:putative competence/damage-inducible protein CinA [Nemania sp. FL0031]
MASSPNMPYITRSTETLFDIASDVICLLCSAGETVSVTESFTAGGVMVALTSVPSASAAFCGGIVLYVTPLKQTFFYVDMDLIACEGVIHANIAVQMAEGAKGATTFNDKPTTWGIGTTGLVGTVFISIASPYGSQSWGPFCFPGTRERVREATVVEALSKLRDALSARSNGGEMGENVVKVG